MMTKAFAANGAAKVYIAGRRKAKLDETAKLAPNIIVPIVCDVTSKDSLCALADTIKNDTGYVNLLICNSGTMGRPVGALATQLSVQEYRAKALEQSTDDWAQTFATNSSAIFFSTMAFLELLDAGNQRGNCAGRKSQVLVTSSIAGFLRVPANMGAYPTSKAAATHLVKHLSGTLVPYSIRVNAVAPGLFPSDLAAGLIAMGNKKKDDPTEEGAFEKGFMPAERTGKLDDMVGTVLYMASKAGAYLNGNITILDGGSMGQVPATY